MVPCGEKFVGREEFKKGKGKFHCSMEVNVRRGDRKGAIRENYRKGREEMG